MLKNLIAALGLKQHQHVEISQVINIYDAVIAHKAWKKRLFEYLEGTSNEDLQPGKICVDYLCALGKWIHSDGKMRFGEQPVFLKLMEEHAKFHVHAAKVVEAAKIAALATKGGWVEHWARALDANRSLVTAFMVVAWSNDCYDAQVINGDASALPDFSSVPNMRRRFFKHPFLVLPHKDLFVDVWKKCVAILASEQKQ